MMMMMMMMVVVGCCVYRAREAPTQTTNTLPPLYRQINREDRLVVGGCLFVRARPLTNINMKD